MERVWFPSRRGFSVRSILVFVLAAVMTVFLWSTLTATSVNAQGAEVRWATDNTLLYNNNSYNRVDNFNDPTGTIPNGATVYQTSAQTVENSRDQKVFVLYFTSGVDPPTATSAQYVEFDYNNDTLSNASNTRDVTATPRGQESSTDSSCSVSGIGWIVCPVSVFLAEAMDNIFKILSEMIAVQPAVLGDTNNSMYVAWNVMRAIANIAFVIAFIIIIYAQLTSIAVSNYGIKKLLPRLVVAAILVNLSFYVAALAIDISNILGYSIQDVFNIIREQLFHMTNDNASGFVTDVDWAVVTSIVLAGGGTIGATYFVATGGLYLLIPILLGLFLTVLFVVVVLAARQAIILILVIIGPLAFVANLLPNTEKWFEKWRDLFMTMLIFFPAFSLVFGGSQLAGQLIIQSANDNIITLLFGMAVQIAPLVITPLLLKFSGNLLGRIAQIANDPRKGLLDRSKNWAGERAELHKQRNLQRTTTGNPMTWGAGLAKSVENGRRKRRGMTDMYKQRADNMWHKSAEYADIHEQTAAADLDKQTIDNQNTAHIQAKANTRGSLLNVKTLELENAKVSAERANAETSAMVSGYRAGAYDTGYVHNPNAKRSEINMAQQRLAGLQQNMAENVIQTAAWKQAEENSKYLQQRNISTRLRDEGPQGEALLNIAEGYGDSDMRLVGRERAKAAAVATLTKLNKDARENTITLMETRAVESGQSVKDFAIGVFRSANQAGSDVHRSQLEAALEIAASDGQVTVFDDARASMHIDQTLVDAVVARHVGDMKSKGGFHIQAKPELSLQRYIEKFNNGEFKPEDNVSSLQDAIKKFNEAQNMARLDTLANTTSSNLGGVKFGAFDKLASDIVPPAGSGKSSILDLLPQNADDLTVDQASMVKKIFESLRGALEDPSTRATMTDRLEQARNIEEAVRSRFFSQMDPLDLSKNERAEPDNSTQRPAPMDQNFPLDTPPVDPTDSTPAEDQDG